MWDRIESHEHQIGRFAWIMAWVGLVVGQLHALARFATADGAEDLELEWTRAWAVPAADLLHPLLGWADADVVYVHYGKVWFPVFAAFTLMALVTYRQRRPLGFEKWVWRVAIADFGLATTGVFFDYWTQWTGDYNGGGIEGTLFAVGWVLTFPSLVLMLLVTSTLGITLLARRFRPVVPAVLMTLMLPGALLVTQVTSLGSAALPVMFAFALIGRRVADGGTVAVAGRRADRREDLAQV